MCLILKKKVYWAVSLILLLLFVVTGIHRTTIRYVDKYGASITPDRQARIASMPFKLNVSGYHFKSVYYSRQQHLFISRYVPAKDPLAMVKHAKYIGVTFQPTTVPIESGTQKDPFILSRNYHGTQSGRDTLRILIGNSYNKYQVLSANYPAISVRDPSIMKDGKTYYIIYTRGLISTTDFTHWKQIKWPAIPGNDYAQDWAPEFVKAKDGKIYVVMSVCKKEMTKHYLAITTFNNGKIGRTWTRLTGNIPTNAIDPDIQYANGQYYLFCKNERIRKLVMGTSDKITGPYKVTQVKFDSSKFGSIEGPEALIENNQIKISFDTYNTEKDGTTIFHGLHYVEKNINGGNWSKMRKINSPIVTRHGQIILNK